MTLLVPESKDLLMTAYYTTYTRPSRSKQKLFITITRALSCRKMFGVIELLNQSTLDSLLYSSIPKDAARRSAIKIVDYGGIGI